MRMAKKIDYEPDYRAKPTHAGVGVLMFGEVRTRSSQGCEHRVVAGVR